MTMLPDPFAKRASLVLALAALCVLFGASGPASAGDPAGKAFPTAADAARALVDAVQTGDDAAIAAVFGTAPGEVLRPTTDPAEKKRRADFLAKATEFVGTEADEDGSVAVVVGKDRWPLPIPLVKTDAGWRFDLEAGKKEILARIVGANELGVIDLLGDVVAAEEAYEAVDRDGDGVREYTLKFRSTPGQTDGLWWEDAKDASPLGLQVGDFLDDVAKNPDPEQTVWGYRWKLLSGQGPKAAGGAFSYVINGNQVAGFACVATPASYRKTGVMTFLVAKNGRIYQKDLGEGGLALVKAMELYDPDDSWTLVEKK